MPAIHTLRRTVIHSSLSAPLTLTHQLILARVAVAGFCCLQLAAERSALRARFRPAVPEVRGLVVATWDPGQCYKATRSFPMEIVEFHDLTQLPPMIRLDNGCVEDGVTALAVMLVRLALPSRHFDLCWIFGRERSILGRIVRYVMYWLHERWGHLLKWSPRRLNPDRLEEIALSLVEEKIYPLDNCVGYIDG